MARRRGRYEAPPPLTLEAGARYAAVLHTELGDITIELEPEHAPQAVNSFCFLAREGYFSGQTFHRVIPGFIAQTGDPTGRGHGGPGYRLPDELSEAPFEAGAVGMANAGPGTAGSQFFVTLEDAGHLTGRFTRFGRVLDGLEVARALRERDPAVDPEAPPGHRLDAVELIEP